MYFTPSVETLMKAEADMYFDAQADIDLSELPLLLKGANLASAPQSLLRRVEAVFDPPAEKPRTVRRLLAALVFDSFAQPALAGARGAAATTRQMVLRTEGFDIHLKIWGAAAGRRMAGQVLARNEGSFVHGARLHLIRDGERFGSTALDKFGEFEFETIPDGFLSLQVDLPHLTVVGTLNANEAA
jgi:hypothetical protein